MSYSSVFGGNTIFPSDVSLLAIALTTNVTLEWPLESSGAVYPAARILDVTPDANGRSVTLPDATLASPGAVLLFNNLSGSYSFTVKDASGGTLATIDFGEQWELYLAGTSTAAGTWRVFQFGASTASVQPSALAGYGLAVTSNTLSQSMLPVLKTVTPYTVLSTDRASLLVWDGTGAGEFDLPAAATVGGNYFTNLRNSSDGDLTIDPSGSEEIDGAVLLVLSPGESVTLATDGLNWYSVGLGQDPVFAFDYTSIDLTGETSPYNLGGSELNRIAYDFIGVMTASIEVVVPSTVQQYWVTNDTTGAFTLSIKTSTQVTGVTIPQGYSAIVYCNGSSIILASASTATLPTTVGVSQGGTGHSTYNTGDILYASAALVLSRLSAVAVGNALISGGVSTAPSWGKIGLTTHVSGTLPVANGGSGTTTSTGTGDLVLATGPTITLPNATGLPLTTGVTGTLPVANGGTGITAFGTGVATALGINVGSAGAFVTFNGAGGTPSSMTLTNATGLPISTGVSGLGSNVATFLATPSSANLIAAVTDETGSGSLVFGTAPTISNPTVTTGNFTDPAITGTILEDIYTITDGAAFEVDPGNGSVQSITLGGNRTPKATNFANGESVTMRVDDGSAFSITWTDATWGGSGVKWIGPAAGGGSAPTLATTGWTWIVLTKIGGQVFGSHVGYSAA